MSEAEAEARFREETLAAQAEEDQREDQGLDDLYRWAARNVDYLTSVCLGPVVGEILAGWERGGGEVPWRDAGPETRGLDTATTSDIG